VIEALERAERVFDGKESVREDPRQSKIPSVDRSKDAEAWLEVPYPQGPTRAAWKRGLS
jgi:hypothetical protein